MRWTLEIGQLFFNFGTSLTAAQDTSGRFDFFAEFPMSHVGMTTFATLTAFDFLGSNITHSTPHARMYWPAFFVPMRLTNPALMSGFSKSIAP